MLDFGTVYVIGYDGNVTGTLKLQNQKLFGGAVGQLAVARDTIAAISPSDRQTILCCTFRAGKFADAEKLLTHTAGWVCKVGLDPCAVGAQQPILSFIDSAKDLFLISTAPSARGNSRSALKIGKSIF